MKYAVVNKDNIESLREMVKDHFDLGWKPLGGICAYYNPESLSMSKIWYCQALIKEEEQT